MRFLVTFFLSAFLPLTASNPSLHVDLKTGILNLHDAPNIADGSAKFGSALIEYKHFRMITSASPLRKYTELGYAATYGFSGNAYSYVDGGTTGIRLQYKYHDRSSSWSPFIGASVQHSSEQYAGIQPMRNFGGTLGLTYHEHKEHLFMIVCFRELRKNAIASTTLSYTYEGEQYFGELKFSATYGNPKRDKNNKSYYGGGLRLGTNLSKRYALYGYAEKSDYADFLLARQVNAGIGLRTSF